MTLFYWNVKKQEDFNFSDIVHSENCLFSNKSLRKAAFLHGLNFLKLWKMRVRSQKNQSCWKRVGMHARVGGTCRYWNETVAFHFEIRELVDRSVSIAARRRHANPCRLVFCHVKRSLFVRVDERRSVTKASQRWNVVRALERFSLISSAK